MSLITQGYGVGLVVPQGYGGVPVPPAILPVAAYVGTPRSGNSPLTVQFTDVSSNTPTSWLWDFGDGVTSTLQNPTHTYSAVGSYTVSLTATNAAGSNTRVNVGYITATLAPVPGGGSIGMTGTATGAIFPQSRRIKEAMQDVERERELTHETQAKVSEQRRRRTVDVALAMLLLRR